MGVSSRFRPFGSSDELAQALSATIADRLDTAIAARGRALLAVSGGTTPARLFRELSQAELDWAKVTVTLVDERFKPESADRSNALLVKRELLKGAAAVAHFMPLDDRLATVDQVVAEKNHRIGRLPLPLDVAVLGMGADGHTASYFPGADNLASLLDPGNRSHVAAVKAAASGEPREARITLTMPVIATARFIALHIEGEDKRKVLDAVLEGRSDPPIAAVLRAAASPVEIFWAP